MLGAVLAKREVVKGFERIGRHDLDGVVEAFHDDAVLEFPGDTVMSGRFEGKEEIRAWFTRWFDQMKEVSFRPQHIAVENIFAMGPTNSVLIEWEVDERNQQGTPYHLTGVTAFDIVGGKIQRAKEYIFDQDVLAEAWPAKEVATT